MDTEKEISIDIMFLLRKLWAKKIVIAATGIFFAALAVAYSVFVTKPIYESTTKVYTVNSNNDQKSPTVQDFQIGNNLVKDYQEIILSKDVLTAVIEEKGVKSTPEALRSKIKVAIPKDTRIISITVSDTDPTNAQKIANDLREISAEKIKEITKIKDVTTIEEASMPKSPSSPNIQKNGAIAFVIGIMLVTLIIALKELLDDKVKRPEDVEEVMGMVLLGMIPDSKKGVK